MALACLLVPVLAATGCVADPPAPTVVGEEPSDGERIGRSAGGIVLAVDRLDEGFNPHLLADQGPDTDLVAALTLPSAFRPGPGGEPVLDTALLDSAQVVPGGAFTVRYRIRDKAQWSDSVPVGAEDFEYLWRQMTTRPGVVDPAGYEHVVAVRAGEGGKVVDVEFDTEVPEWRALFTHLLPAHLLKDAPDGFQGGFRGVPKTSAGPFMTRAADLGRGEIELVPNDRYWEAPPALAQLILRRASDAGALGGVLRSGPGSLAMVADTPVNADVLRTVPGFTSTTSTSTTQLELDLSTTGRYTSDPAVRRAVTAAVEPGVIGRIVTGETAPETVGSPFPGAAPASARDAGEVDRRLTAAGWTRGERWTRAGEPLSLTIGVDPTSEAAVTAANTVADQLRSAGIGARVWELEAASLYGDALPHDLVDAVVGWQRVDGDPLLAAVSRYACAPGGRGEQVTDPARPVRSATTVASLAPPAPDDGVRQRPSGSSTSPSPTPGRAGPSTAPARASGVAGLCDPAVDAALGRVPGGRPDLAAAGRLVDALDLRVPLVRPRHLLGSDATTAGPGAPGATPPSDTEVFDTAPTWRREG